jgi:glycosyltransferase involved in cell wall biosynthesis
MLYRLSNQISRFEKDIEIVVSDNCSTDATPEIISDWAAVQNADLIIKHVRQPENIGISRNLVSLLYASTSDYFIFLGDDDQLDSTNFSKLVDLLTEKRPSAVIQARWEGRRRTSKIGRLGFEDALSLFYEYGNAWAGVIDRDAAIKAIDSRALRHEIELIVWPQTVFGYLAMFDLLPLRSVEAVDFEIGRPITKSLNLTNKTYWIRSFKDLLQAAALIQRVTKSTKIRGRFVSFKSVGLVGHIKAIFWNTLVDCDRSSLSEIRNLLVREFGFRGQVCAFMLRLDDYPELLRLISSVGYRLIYVRSGRTLAVKIFETRRKREDEFSNKDKVGKRHGDWF